MNDAGGPFVLGMGAITALGAGVPNNFSRLCAGEIGIRPMTRFRPERYITGVAGEVTGETYATLEGRFGPGLGTRALLLALCAADEALEGVQVSREETALILSTTKADFDEFEAAMASTAADSKLRFNPIVLAEELATRLLLGGPVYAVSNACASGLIAVAQAMRVIKRSQAAHVLVIGVDTLSDFVISGFSSLRALSTAPARPFDAARSGLSLGEGAGALLLSRDRGSRPLARILGQAGSNDAEHITAPSKEGRGLREAIGQCLRRANRSTSQVGYINAHGTGTRFNDEMECQAVARAFEGVTTPALTSMKGSLGHTLGAAGVIEAALSIEALRSKTIPPSPGYSDHGVSLPLHIPKETTPAPNLDTVLCMKSGFGGVNAVVAFGGV